MAWAHESDLGLVQLNITSSEQLAAAYDAVRAVDGLPTAVRDAVVVYVQPMVRAELEFLVGMTTEEPLGRFLVAGWGGLYAEDIDDVVTWALPATEEEIRQELLRTAIGRAVSGRRWSRPGTLDETVDVLVRLQVLADAAGPRLRALKLNPLGLSHADVVALDALAAVGPAAATGALTPTPHEAPSTM